MASSNTPSIGDAIDDLASPLDTNPILARARNRINSIRDTNNNPNANSNLPLRVLPAPLKINESIPSIRDSTTDSKDENNAPRYRRRRLSVRDDTLQLAPTNTTSIPPPPKKVVRRLPKKPGSLFIVTDQLNQQMKESKENFSPSNIDSIQKNISEHKQGLEINDVMQIANEMELDQLQKFVSAQKWIPLWSKIAEHSQKFVYYPEDVNSKEKKNILFTDHVPKDLEQEGFYVEESPNNTQWNLSKMERRLLAFEDIQEKEWFGLDLKLDIEPIPLNSSFSRNSRYIRELNTGTDIENSMVPHYNEIEIRKAYKSSTFRRVMDSPDGTYTLCLELNSLELTDHPFMTQEFKLAKYIQELMESWTDRKRTKVVQFLTDKLEALKKAYEDMNRVVLAPSAEALHIENGPLKPLHNPFYTRFQDRMDTRKTQRALQEQENKRLLLKEIRATRLLRDAETKVDRMLEYRILKSWSELKKLRKHFGYSSTRVHLSVRLKESNQEQDKANLEREIEQELDELQQLNQSDNVSKKRLYDRQLEDWNKKHELYEQIRQQKRNEFQENQSKNRLWKLRELEMVKSTDALAAITEQEIAKQTQDVDELEWVDDVFEKPPPTPFQETVFDETSHRKEIKARLHHSKRPIGAPIINFVFSTAAVISETASCPRDEQLRRRDIESTFIFLKIFYNDKQVTKTMAYPLHSINFTVQFERNKDLKSLENTGMDAFEQDLNGSFIELKVKEIPESIRIEVFETGLFGDVLVGELFVPTPNPSKTVNSIDSEFSNIDFSGRPFTLETPMKRGDLYKDSDQWYSGKLKLHCAWGTDEFGVSLGPKAILSSHLREHPEVDPILRNGPAGLLNLANLLDWVSELKLDPNDPKNGDIMSMKQLIVSIYSDSGMDAQTLREYWSSKKHFRLHPPKWLDSLIQGVGKPASENIDKRLELLQMRYKQEIGQTCIPLLEKDIRDQDFPIKRIYDPSGAKKRHGSLNMTSASESVGFVKRIRYHQLINKARLAVPAQVDDFVREERLPPPAPQVNLFDIIFPIYRPLNPFRVERRTLAATNPESCKIIIQVLRGFNLPSRTFGNSTTQKKREPSSPLSPTSLVNPEFDSTLTRAYVEASFQRTKVRTAAREGTSPQWNETLSLDVTTPTGDLSVKSFVDSEIGLDCLFLNLFDEIIVDLLEDEKERQDIVHHRKERNWLGSLHIPFATIWERVKMDGMFHMKIPVLSMGYEKGESASAAEVPTLAGLISSGETLLHLFVTLDPPLMQPPPLKLKFQSDEPDKLLKYSKQWTKSLETFKRINFTSTIDINGKTVFIPRYIKAQKTPPSIDSLQQILRYVSLIPVVPDRTAFSADCMIWSTSDQVLEIGVGDNAELATLLCNFLLYKEFDAFVVLGRGLTDGVAAFVMVRDERVLSATSLMDVKLEEADQKPKNTNEPQKYSFFDPTTGDVYSKNDAHIPLKEVGCIFNHQNIWANIQKTTELSRISLRLQDTFHWKPFFDAKYPLPEDLKSVQKDNLTFDEFPKDYLLRLEGKIERGIVENVEKWREGKITRWNKLCSRSFKTVLPILENDLMAGIPISSTLQESRELATLKSVYNIIGFPLNTTYTDIDAILALVHNTGIHTNADRGIEFAVSVHCIGYPGRFISVWIYLCNLRKTYA